MHWKYVLYWKPLLNTARPVSARKVQLREAVTGDIHSPPSSCDRDLYENWFETILGILIMRPPPAPSRPFSGRMRFGLLHLICAAAIFSLFVFGIQSSFFAGKFLRFVRQGLTFTFHYLVNRAWNAAVAGSFKISYSVHIQILLDFQSSVQQCMVRLPILNLRFNALFLS